MQILGIQGMSDDQVNFEVAQGARFVYFTYCFSVLIMTFKRSSDVFFIRAGESRVAKGLPYVLLTLLVGWWGIPWGPIWTIGCIAKDLSGGEDVTAKIAPGAYETALMAGRAK